MSIRLTGSSRTDTVRLVIYNPTRNRLVISLTVQNVSYRDGVLYLNSKTNVYELYNQFGGRVTVCPDWNGRVMTSSCNGIDGNSFGFINVKAIESSVKGAHSYFGGEEQLLFSQYIPDDADARNVDAPFQVPASFREDAFQVDFVPQDTEIRMRRSIQMSNPAGASFDWDVVRTVKLLDLNSIRSAFGNTVAVSLEQTDVSYVGFSTVNSMYNIGASFSRTSGLVAMQSQSMFNANSSTIAVIPLRNDDDEDSRSVQTDFFGAAPHGRVRFLNSAILLRCDGEHRCQVRVFPKRAVPYLGALDFRSGSLTLSAFVLPEEPVQQNYLRNDCCKTLNSTVSEITKARKEMNRRTAPFPAKSALPADTEITVDDCPPSSGDVLRAYNHGPCFPGDDAYTSFYAFEVFSPAEELPKGGSQTHQQHILHIDADNKTLDFLVQKFFGTDYGEIYDKMMK